MGHRFILDPSQDDLYIRSLTRLERGCNSTDKLHPQNSHKLRFLDLLLRIENSLSYFKGIFHKVWKEALDRTPETLQDASDEWNEFTDIFFRKQNRPVPEWPFYIQVQEELGIYRNTTTDRLGRTLRRKALRRLSLVFKRLSETFPNWTWASRNHCYTTAAVWNHYRLPSGKYKC